MDEDVVAALEEAIADLGSLLVQTEKFRAATADDARALRATCLAVGDRARRAHRHGTLDVGLASALGAEAGAARAALEGWLAGVRSSPAYTRAVAALTAGDMAALRAMLPTLFEGVTAVPPPTALFHPVQWQRRGRPRPAADVAEELARWREAGVPGDGDPAAPGVDPALPGVLLLRIPPAGAPLHLVLRGDARPAWVLELAETGDVIVPGERLRAAFAVALADPDADEIDAWAMDPAALRRDLAAALDARGIPLDRG